MSNDKLDAKKIRDYEICQFPFPVFNLLQGIDERNIGYVQGVLDSDIPFAAEKWRYEGEETVVVYIPDLGLIDRDTFLIDDGGIEKELPSTKEYVDLSVLNMSMECKFIEGIDEINIFYAELLEELGVIEFCSNTHNSLVTYYEDKNGLEIIAISILIKQGKDEIAECSLSFLPFETGEDEPKEAFIECCVYVTRDNEFVMSLDAGMESVIHFARIADQGIEGCIHLEKGWYCNRDVTIEGKSLLKFMRENYPGTYEKNRGKIIETEIYKIVADDFS